MHELQMHMLRIQTRQLARSVPLGRANTIVRRWPLLHIRIQLGASNFTAAQFTQPVSIIGFSVGRS